MSAAHPVWAILLTALAVLLSFLLTRGQLPDQKQARFTSIDGLRGYLAFFVFLHHSLIWHAYVQTGVWEVPPSHLYTHLGQSSVSMFFMITSFLFYTKLLDSRGKRFDWPKLLISRVLRLTPLYLFAMLVMLTMVAILSKGVAQDSVLYITKCVVQWLSFTITGAPSINQINPLTMVAGVTWSLPYEWIFYLALPLLGLTTGVRAAWPFLAMSVASLVFAAMHGLSLHFAFIFAGGMAGAVVVRHAGFKQFAASHAASALVVVCVLSLLWFPTAYGVPQLLLLTAAFSLIAGGASVFGALSCATSRRFGDTAYSIYLLHGIVLFIAFNYVAGIDMVKGLTPTMYWLFIAALVPVLLGACFLTFRFIEQPGMALTPQVMGVWRPPKGTAI